MTESEPTEITEDYEISSMEEMRVRENRDFVWSIVLVTALLIAIAVGNVYYG